MHKEKFQKCHPRGSFDQEQKRNIIIIIITIFLAFNLQSTLDAPLFDFWYMYLIRALSI